MSVGKKTCHLNEHSGLSKIKSSEIAKKEPKVSERISAKLVFRPHLLEGFINRCSHDRMQFRLPGYQTLTCSIYNSCSCLEPARFSDSARSTSHRISIISEGVRHGGTISASSCYVINVIKREVGRVTV